MTNKNNNRTEAKTSKQLTNGYAKIEAAVRKLIKVAALIILSYLAWKGVSGLVGDSQTARDLVAYVSVIGLLALYLLV